MITAVFGGRGFIGSALVRRLLKEGHQVRVLDNGNAVDSHANLQHFKIDFSRTESFHEVLTGCEAVFQLISTSLPNTSVGNSLADVQGNLLPTLRLLDQMSQMGIRRLIFPSSGGTVYGEAQYLPIDEAHPTRPIVPYGATKLSIEKYLEIYRHAGLLETICLRISNPYGPGFRPESPQGAIGAFLLKAKRNETIDIWGTGDIKRDYLYIDDLVEALVSSLCYQGPMSTFNISTGIGTSLNELIDIVTRVTGKELKVRHHERRSFDVQDNWLSCDLAHTELGWTPRVSLPEGIRQTYDWVQARL